MFQYPAKQILAYRLRQIMKRQAWLIDRFEEGLIFLKSTERGKCFIEYIPAENAWNPIVPARINYCMYNKA